MTDAPSGTTVKKVGVKSKASGSESAADGKKRFEVKKVRSYCLYTHQLAQRKC